MGSASNKYNGSSTFSINVETIKEIMKKYNYTDICFKYILGCDYTWVEAWGQITYVDGREPYKDSVKHQGGSHWDEIHYYEINLSDIDVENISDISVGFSGYEYTGAYKRTSLWY